MMFADAIDQISPATGWQMLCFVIAAVSLWSSVSLNFSARRTQRRSVEMVEEFATRKELTVLSEKVECKVDDLRVELKEMEQRIDSKDESRTAEIHKRFNEFGENLGRLRGFVEGREDK